MILPDIVKLATGVTTEEEGRETLSLLQGTASLALSQSKRELEIGIICLHLIREHCLYQYGGYSDWQMYLTDFLDSEMIGRSLAYDLLHVVRQWTNSCHLSLDDLSSFGLYTARAALGGLVSKYDRATGEVTAVSPRLVGELDGRGSLGEQTGRWIVQNIPAGVGGGMVAQLTANVGDKLRVDFWPVRDGSRIVDVGWSATMPDGGQSEGRLAQMPPVVEKEFLRLLKSR